MKEINYRDLHPGKKVTIVLYNGFEYEYPLCFIFSGKILSKDSIQAFAQADIHTHIEEKTFSLVDITTTNQRRDISNSFRYFENESLSTDYVENLIQYLQHHPHVNN